MRTCSSSPRAVQIALANMVLTGWLISAAVGQSKLPIQRFGVSEFRLTAKGGNDRPFRFSPDGKLIAGANWEEVRLWSFPDGKLLHDFSGAIQTNCIGFAADGKEFLALEQRRMEVYRFDVASWQTARPEPGLQKSKTNRVPQLTSFHADGQWLFA